MFNIFNKNTSNDKKIKIIISIDNQDNIKVEYDYDKKNLDHPTKIATLLYSINNRLLIQNFIYYLLQSNDINLSSFVLEKWASIDKLSSPKNNEPVIKPLNAFFKNVK